MAESTHVHVTHQFKLDQACRPLVDAFGWRIFQVGSSLHRRDWHDIDVRCLLDDELWEQMFQGEAPTSNGQRRPRLEILNAALSEWLRVTTGLPVDFQFQQLTAANKEFGKAPRSALGVVMIAKREEK